jgi:hypothetical protein
LAVGATIEAIVGKETFALLANSWCLIRDEDRAHTTRFRWVFAGNLLARVVFDAEALAAQPAQVSAVGSVFQLVEQARASDAVSRAGSRHRDGAVTEWSGCNAIVLIDAFDGRHAGSRVAAFVEATGEIKRVELAETFDARAGETERTHGKAVQTDGFGGHKTVYAGAGRDAGAVVAGAAGGRTIQA